MKKFAVAIFCALAIAACGDQKVAEPVSTVVNNDRPGWEEFARTTIDEFYNFYPEAAVDAGLHEYDGKMEDRSAAGQAEKLAWLEQVIADASAYSELEGIDAFERDYLKNYMQGRAFWLRDSGFVSSNPLAYLGFDVSVYVDREYAPLRERLGAYTRYVSQIPAALKSMRDNLKPPLPMPYIEISHGVITGFADYLESTVPEAFAEVEDEQLQRQFRAANGDAIEAARQAGAWLNELRATGTDDYALGEELFLKMLRDTQGVDITLDRLIAAGELDLERNLDALYEACAEFAPGASTEDCVLKVQNRKPPEGAVAGAARQLPALKEFVIAKKLVSIPSDDEALVAEAPPHRRFNAAYISIPGPFELGLPSVYYIAPPDPSWSEEDQRAYVPGETDLLAISVHEVWPGHFLQFLHSNRTDNKVGRHFSTYTFTEGWAHYAEEMMVDAGLGEGDPEVKIGQLLNALLRNIRYMSAIGLHAQDMTVDESRQLFLDKAFQDFGNAEQQAYRGTYDPGYLNYTLGKLMINKLREDWTRSRGGETAWGRFHNEFLSFGAPPIPLVRKQMLGEDYEGDDALLPQPAAGSGD